MIKFLQEHYLQLCLLLLLIGITTYAISIKNTAMINTILTAVFAGLNLTQLKK